MGLGSRADYRVAFGYFTLWFVQTCGIVIGLGVMNGVIMSYFVRRLGVSVVALVALAAGVTRADLIIADVMMNDADWSVVKFIDTTPSGAATGSSSQVPTGGFAGPECRQTRHIWQIVPSGVSIAFFHSRSDAVWDPAVLGPIDTVFTGVRFRCDSAPIVNAVGIGQMLEQGGSYYYHAPSASAAIPGGNWSSLPSVPLAAADWTKIAGLGPINPEFGTSGAPIRFGYYTSNGGTGVNLLNTAVILTDAYELLVDGSLNCQDIDFNNDGASFDPQDIDAFLSVYSEGSCVPASATCDDIDFNGDGASFDPCDFDSFLTIFAEGPCTLCGQ